MKQNKVGAGMCMAMVFLGSFLATTAVGDGNVPLFAYGVLTLLVGFFAASLIEGEQATPEVAYV